MRTLLRKRSGGFTLIELMIVVAIIGILAAIAIPNFLRFQLRAKSSEGKTNLAAIRTAEEGYFAEFGTYVSAPQNPASLPGSTKAPWGGGNSGFNTMGWTPEGDVYFSYLVDQNNNNEFMAGAQANIDGNATTQQWGYVKPVPGNSSYGGTAPFGCSVNGTYDPIGGSSSLIETVGPCDSTSGQSEF